MARSPKPSSSTPSTTPAASASDAQDPLKETFDAMVDDAIPVPSDGTPATGVATGDGTGEKLLEAPEDTYGPDAKPLEEDTDAAAIAAAAWDALSDEEKAKLLAAGTTVQLGGEIPPPPATIAGVAPPAEGGQPPPNDPTPPLPPSEHEAQVECEDGHLKGSAKVWEHGSLKLGGKYHPPGTVLLLCPCDISDEDAEDLVHRGVLVNPHES